MQLTTSVSCDLTQMRLYLDCKFLDPLSYIYTYTHRQKNNDFVHFGSGTVLYLFISVTSNALQQIPKNEENGISKQNPFYFYQLNLFTILPCHQKLFNFHLLRFIRKSILIEMKSHVKWIADKCRHNLNTADIMSIGCVVSVTCFRKNCAHSLMK